MAFEFTSPDLEEFYNSCHTTDTGRFCGRGAKGKKVLRVPMSDAARRSNAILRRMSADRKSKEYKTARERVNDTWANREKGQGGLRSAGAGGRNSGKADAARARNAVKGAVTRTKGNPNKDGSEALKGRFRTSGDRKADMIKITQLDRGSPERKLAVKAYEKAYGGK